VCLLADVVGKMVGRAAAVGTRLQLRQKRLLRQRRLFADDGGTMAGHAAVAELLKQPPHHQMYQVRAGVDGMTADAAVHPPRPARLMEIRAVDAAVGLPCLG
jgi:hypothetical protein